jgi:hypothetical protein
VGAVEDILESSTSKLTPWRQDALRRKMQLKMMLAWLLLTQTAAFAEGEMALRGVGTSSCAEFANTYAKDPHNIETIYFSWAQGYWSCQNSNLLPNDQYRELAGSTDAQKATLRSYCDKHPLAIYWEAAVAVFFSFPLKDLKQ